MLENEVLYGLGDSLILDKPEHVPLKELQCFPELSWKCKIPLFAQALI